MPLITKGKNDVKMIFVISDGEDNTDSKQVRKTLMDKYHLCDVIRNGLKNTLLERRQQMLKYIIFFSK
ncbi:hypothetical protein AL525_000015 [Citrobacter amalonaticus]|nr:hypothetical protein AL525_000015 [Citrobacter amalonaticus]